MEKIKFFKLECPEEIWKDFKGTINKNYTINEILLELVKERIKKFKEKNEN